MAARTKILIAVGTILALTAAGVGIFLQQAQEAARAQAHYEELRNRREYRAETVACGIRFPSGNVSRVTAYDESFRWRGYRVELAGSSDDSEGEQWAEFYALDDAAAAQALIDGFAADLTHLLIRQRLWQHYFQGGFLDDVDQLADKHRVLAAGDESGWRIRMSVIENAALPAQVVAPPSMATLHLPHLPDILERMREARWSDWRALDLDDPERQADRDAYRAAERSALQPWRDNKAELQRQKERFARAHRQFYLVEAARDLGAGHVLIIRRFGSLIGSATLEGAAQKIAGMADSLTCLSAEADAPL